MTDLTAPATASPTAPPGHGELEPQLETHRRELTAHCYRMLGSAFEAEDAAQETLVRAWRALDRFEGRSSLRTWLYRIATNVCLDALDGKERRARPMDLGPSSTTAEATLAERPEATWLEPVPDGRVLPSEGDPAELAVARDSIRLAFVAALQHLPPKQRAVLIFREVLAWKAAEVAELLDTSVASVNSALQRARATLAASDVSASGSMDDAHTALLARYLEAFERYDIDALVLLLHEDATMSMPPLDLWLQGREEIARWLLGPGAKCRGSRFITTMANGVPAFAQYRVAPEGGFTPWALHVLDVRDGRITDWTSFLDTQRLFPLFGLPPRLDES